MKKTSTVRVQAGQLVLPTYLPDLPDKNPMFLEKRVYQGSSGKVYPLPFTDRIADSRTDRAWKAVWIENEYLRVAVLPEIGGRIHIGQDKTNGYDFIYRQNVIKPALVGLAGPWISGGIEFNWPQHHRPATFLPVDFDIERGRDGSATVWLSDHDPMTRMKGMHGVCLRPGKALVEIKARACNRTPFVQTFLWWTNIGIHVHEWYQSFLPPDVQYVADHARRAMSRYPLCQDFYYGVDYGKRGRRGIPPEDVPINFVPPHCRSGEGSGSVPVFYAPNDLTWYANIPTPCSYMGLDSQEDFIGGYDHRRRAGFVHVADHHIAPGKKQWTWGNDEFGYAWDRNLTDADGPYIEIMAGVYTDNQPDFSFLHPGETRTWSQFLYPFQQIGPVQHANLQAALHLRIESGQIALGVAVSEPITQAAVRLSTSTRTLRDVRRDLAPNAPLVDFIRCPEGVRESDLRLSVTRKTGETIIAYAPHKPRMSREPMAAAEPSSPAEIRSTDELFVTGLHLEQYRHATRCPTVYWREALRRDPLDSRCNNAMGRWHLRRGELVEAEKHFRAAIQRLTQRNANPCDGEPFYNLGLCLRFQLDALAPPERDTGNELFDQAYAAFCKATWNQPWQSAAFHALAELDCRRREWSRALDHLDHSLRLNLDHLCARNLKVMVLRQLDHHMEADELLRQTVSLDPLDWWARHLQGERPDCDLQTGLDIAHDLARAGFHTAAIQLLKAMAAGPRAALGRMTARGSPPSRSSGPGLPTQSLGALPLVHYTLGWLYELSGDQKAATSQYRLAARQSPDYCFPSRLEEIAVLKAACRARPRDARAPYYLGNLLYDRRRYREAIELWERSVQLDPGFAVTWRNLGIGYFNVLRRRAKACHAYDEAIQTNPQDARLLYERDQLWKRMGARPTKRLRELEKYPSLVRRRDDLCIELCALYNQVGKHERALELMGARRFQPWEGGEGLALAQHARTHLALGQAELRAAAPARAREHFEAALQPPESLGETRHPLANQSDVHYFIGLACDAQGDTVAARRHWRMAATFKGDFQGMTVRPYSEMTFYSALAWHRLGRRDRAEELFRELLAYARALERSEAKIDYFATSLPTMLLFDEDLQSRQETTALFLQAQARLGLGDRRKARALLKTVLHHDPNHPQAADLLQCLSTMRGFPT